MPLRSGFLSFLFFSAMLLSSLSQAAEKVVLQLSWTHQYEFAGFYAALEKGFYRHEGLDVTIRPGGFNVRSSLEEVLSGKATFGVTGSELLLARTSGQPVVALGVIFQHSAAGIATLAESGILTPQDFSGKRLEIGELTNDAETYAVLLAEGITDKQYEHIPSSFSTAQLISQKSDAVSVYTTNQPYELEKAGIPYRLILPRSYGIDFYGDTMFTSEDMINQKPELVKAFVRASLRGWKYAFDRPDEIIDLILQKYSDFPNAHTREHLEFEYRQMKELILPELVELGHMNETRWRHMANTFVSLGLLQPDYSLEGFQWTPKQDRENQRQLYLKIALIVIASILLMLVLLFFYNRKLQEQIALKAEIEHDLKDSIKKQDIILWAGELGYWRWDRDKGALFLDDISANLLGGYHESREFVLKELSNNSDIASVRNFFSHFGDTIREHKARFQIENDLIDGEGQPRHILCKGEPLSFTEEGKLDSAHGIFTDITEQRKSQQQLEQLAITDTLTGLLNRRYYMSRLSAFMQRVKFGEGHFSIIIIDIDNMESVNAEYGEHTGDLVIETIADILQQQVRPLDLVARYSGQVFAILMPDISATEAYTTCEKINSYISHYRFDTSNKSFFVSVTGGIVDTQEFSLADLNSKQLFYLAEERVKEGKAQGKQRFIMSRTPGPDGPLSDEQTLS
ncbi:ABC transporter substrate-binding protein [Oceanospirillum sediminis]|uniref:Thiamine pyrimidine synthase n=1 Tax=Oceanospirillum sediminis TaxID=2760088 RepID=A0A839IUE0_9GAMM|nr:ABC transporter substrate-binding protein [Oceanospirillum sediminis]MBB1487736.1 ABC transporter substrate-binding protein [Oceanospirillum sediminis]